MLLFKFKIKGEIFTAQVDTDGTFDYFDNVSVLGWIKLSEGVKLNKTNVINAVKLELSNQLRIS